MTDVDERGLQLLNWLDERGEAFSTEGRLLGASAREISPTPTQDELEWLARSWRDRRAEGAASVGAPDAVEGPAPADDGEGSGAEASAAASPEPAGAGPSFTDAGPVIDPETGEILDEDIPFEVDVEAEEELLDESDGDRPSTELVPVQPELVSLFGPGGPEVAMMVAARYAVAFREFVIANELTLEMEDGTLYVTSAGWEAGGQMNGVFTEIEEVRQMQGGWMVKAYAHRPSTGERWTSAYALCLRAEKGKKWHSEHDLLAMAETRARRLALRPAISILVTAAGFDATPPDERKASPKQHARLQQMFEQMAAQPGSKRTKQQWHDQARQWTLQRFGKQQLRELTRAEISLVMDGMQRKLDEGKSDDTNPVEGQFAGAEV